MNLIPHRSLFFLSLIALGFCVPASANGDSLEVMEAEAPRAAPWHRLAFEGEKYFRRVNAEVELRPPGPDDPPLVPADGRHGPVLLPDEQEVLFLYTRIDADALGKEWIGQIWFLAERGDALQRIRFKPGDDGSFKRYRYGQDGVYRKRAEPKDRTEARLPPAQWTDVRDSFYPHHHGTTACEPVVDPATLLYILTTTDWSDEEEREYCVFNKQGLHRAQLKRTGTERVRASFRQGQGDSNQTIDREFDTWKIRLTSRPLGPDSSDLDPFEFLGFEGELEILLSTESGIPLRLTGAIPRIGEVELNLTDVAVP